MKRILTAITALIMFVGCTYTPELKTAPKNEAKYKVDLSYCQEWAKPHLNEILMGGLLGYAGNQTMPRGNNTIDENVDYCLRSKGYDPKGFWKQNLTTD